MVVHSSKMDMYAKTHNYSLKQPRELLRILLALRLKPNDFTLSDPFVCDTILIGLRTSGTASGQGVVSGHPHGQYPNRVGLWLEEVPVETSTLPRCQSCNSGDLVPLSDFGGQGAAIHYKAWACTNPGCGFNIKIRNGDLYLNEPISNGSMHTPRVR